MKTTMVLCLLITIYGLSITISKAEDGNQNQQEFDIVKAYSDVRSRKDELVTMYIEEMEKMKTFIRDAHINISNIFNAQINTELNNTRAAVNAAIAKGNAAEHCYQDAVGMFQKVHEDMERQFVSCQNINVKDYEEDLRVLCNIIKVREYPSALII
uniref:Venom protein n=1 Tax=Ampulex compressa TaxID=860918 RepID=A0A1W6EVZ8_AMPCP|nr:venom protein [Ampulex compressa]